MSQEDSLHRPSAADLEIQLKEAELALKRAELAQKSATPQQRWANPLVIAVFTAAAAAAGNGLVAYVNGMQQRVIERIKAEAAQVLEAIKTGNPDTAAENLRLLVDASLLSDPDRVAGIRSYLAARQPGEGASLPVAGGAPREAPSRLQDLPADHPARRFAPAVGLFMAGDSRCTASLIAPDIVLTMSYCFDASAPAQDYGVTFPAASSGRGEVRRQVVMPPLVQRATSVNSGADSDILAGDLDFVLFRLSEPVEPDRAPLRLAREPPIPGIQARLLMHQGEAALLVAEGVRCTVEEVGPMRFRHACASGAGSAGGPIIAGDGRTIGFEFAGSAEAGFAIRADRIVELTAVETVLAAP
jgi:hypothetical protein